MKSFGSYISKYLASFVAFILILLFLNAVVFGLTFQKIVKTPSYEKVIS